MVLLTFSTAGVFSFCEGISSEINAKIKAEMLQLHLSKSGRVAEVGVTSALDVKAVLLEAEDGRIFTRLETSIRSKVGSFCVRY